MSSARTRTYHPRRGRREVAIAVLAVAAIFLVTGGLVLLFAPHDDTNPVPASPAVTLPVNTSLPSDATPPSTPPTASPAP